MFRGFIDHPLISSVDARECLIQAMQNAKPRKKMRREEEFHLIDSKEVERY